MDKLNGEILPLIYFYNNIRIFNYLNIWYTPTHFRFRIIRWIYFLFWRLFRLNAFLVIVSIIISLLLDRIEVLDQYTTRVFITFSVSTLFFQIVYLSSYTDTLTEIFQRFTKCLDISIKIFGSEKVVENLLIWNATARKITLISMGLWSFSGFHWMIRPILVEYKTFLFDNNDEISNSTNLIKDDGKEEEFELPYNGYYFSLNKYATPFYQIIYVSEMSTTVYLAVFSGALDSFVASFLVCIRGMFQQVIAELYKTANESPIYFEGINKNDEMVKLKNLKDVIVLHQQILKLYQQFTKVTSLVLFLLCLKCFVAMCILSFNASTLERDDPNLLNMVQLGPVFFFELFLFSWHGENVSQQGKKVGEAAYFSDWEYYNMNKEIGLCVRFIIQRSQKILKLRGEEFYIINLELPTHILQATFSVYTLLKQVQENKNS